MSTQIFYFTGTGNSLHVARELARRLPEVTLEPMVGALQSDRLETEADTVGWVFPIHNLTMPIPVRRFLERVDLSSARYTFAISTRFCSDKLFADMDRILAPQGRTLDATFALETPCTYTPLFEIPPQETLDKMASRLQQELDDIQAIVAAQKPSRIQDGPLVYVIGRVLYPTISAYIRRFRFPEMARSFYAEDQCTGCGLCERVCLSERIRMRDGRPEWLESVECLYCFACLHYCPVQAVQIRGRKTVGKGRYHHPQVTATDIAAQKQS